MCCDPLVKRDPSNEGFQQAIVLMRLEKCAYLHVRNSTAAVPPTSI